MKYYPFQPLLKAKWNLENKEGKIITKRKILNKTLKGKPEVLYLAFFRSSFFGGFIDRYLGESDGFGRPIIK